MASSFARFTSPDAAPAPRGKGGDVGLEERPPFGGLVDAALGEALRRLPEILSRLGQERGDGAQAGGDAPPFLCRVPWLIDQAGERAVLQIELGILLPRPPGLLLEDGAFELPDHERPVDLLLGRQRPWIDGANLLQQRLLRRDPPFDRRTRQVGGRSAWHVDEPLNQLFEAIAGLRALCLREPGRRDNDTKHESRLNASSQRCPPAGARTRSHESVRSRSSGRAVPPGAT